MTKKDQDYVSIDDLLAEEFKIDDTEDVEEQAEEAVEPEEKDVIQTEDNNPEANEQEVEAKPQPKPKEGSKQDAAFARLRVEKTEAERLAREQEEFIKGLAAQAGFADVNQFKEAINKEISKKKAEAAGITPEAYEKMNQLESRVNQLEAEKAQMTTQERAQNFTAAAEKFAKDYGLGTNGAETIYARLDELGYTIEDILITKSPETLIKGAMADVLQKQALQTHLQKKETKPKVDTERLDARGDVDTEDWEALLSKDLEVYARNNGFSR